MEIDKEEFSKLKPKDKVPFKCIICNEIFHISKNSVQQWKRKNVGKRCGGYRCKKQKYSDSYSKKIKINIPSERKNKGERIKTNCTQCNKIINKLKCQTKKSKLLFCGNSCSAIYRNQHKTWSCGISKLEKYIQSQLTIIFPNLKFIFNDNSIIKAELDIYLPELKLAFELNGPFHYEPIFGQEALAKVQNNDKRKFQACLERGIEFCTIDTSKQTYFKEKTSKVYLDIIINVIKTKLIT